MFTGCRREYHPEAQTSQKVTNKFAKEPPEKNNHIQLKQGWILRIQKFREGIDLWLLCANLLLNVLYHIYVRMKIRESRLQNGSFIYKMGISLTKQDFKLQKETLGLQTGLSDCYLPIRNVQLLLRRRCAQETWMFTGCRREYHPEAQTSQKVTNKFAKEPPEKNNHIQLKQGWILRIQKFREGIDLWLLCANLLLNVLYHIYVRMKIRESRLQNGSFIYKMGISLTKQDFKLQKEILGLQTGLSDCYLPKQ